jgi:hypothetical protein
MNTLFLFYCGGKGNVIDIYENNFENNGVTRIIEDAEDPKYSKKSNYILHRKSKQTGGLYRFKKLGFYVYDRGSKEMSFFRLCDHACFIRPAGDFISYYPYDVF